MVNVQLNYVLPKLIWRGCLANQMYIFCIAGPREVAEVKPAMRRCTWDWCTTVRSKSWRTADREGAARTAATDTRERPAKSKRNHAWNGAKETVRWAVGVRNTHEVHTTVHSRNAPKNIRICLERNFLPQGTQPDDPFSNPCFFLFVCLFVFCCFFFCTRHNRTTDRENIGTPCFQPSDTTHSNTACSKVALYNFFKFQSGV